MEILSANTENYPRIGDEPEQQRLKAMVEATRKVRKGVKFRDIFISDAVNFKWGK